MTGEYQGILRMEGEVFRGMLGVEENQNLLTYTYQDGYRMVPRDIIEVKLVSDQPVIRIAGGVVKLYKVAEGCEIPLVTVEREES